MAFSISSLSKTIQSSKVVSQKRQHLRTIVPRVQHGVSEIFKWLNTSPGRLKRWAQQRAVKAWSGDPNESAKKIIHNPSATKIFSKTVVHIPPIVAAVVLLALNFTGYFIGNEMTGWNFGSWQDFYKICLQVAAKVHELCIVASLSTVIMDIIRHELLQAPQGLPLGVLTAKTQFMDVFYLSSPDFRHGICAVSGHKRALLGGFIFICTVISLLAGPSSALLLIPDTYDQDWRAGGAQFQIQGNHDDLWPVQLDHLNIGGEHCQLSEDGDKNRPLQPKIDETSCIWAGYAAMSQWWTTSPPSNKKVSHMPMQDGAIRKMIDFHWPDLGMDNSNSSAGAITVPLAPCAYSDVLGDLWLRAVSETPGAQGGSLSKFRNYKYRDRVGSKITMPSEMPVVWTTCLTNDSVTYADVVDKTYFPLQYQFSEYKAVMVAHENPVSEGQMFSQQLSFNTTMYINSSRVAAIWLETPLNESIGTRFDGGRLTGRSSAYINIQVPSSENITGSGFLASCAIDAWWYRSSFMGSGAAQGQTDTVYEPPGLPVIQRTGDWRSVRLRSSWLNTLTPSLGNTQDDFWNTLSSTIAEIGLVNTREIEALRNADSTWMSPDIFIAAVVSATIADGMSRTGFEKNGGDGKLYYPWDLSPESMDEIYGDRDRLLEGDYQLRPPPGVEPDSSKEYRMQWNIAISGLGYQMDGFAYYIASGILFTHMAIALCHIAWVIRTGHTSTAWSSLNELIVLVFKSPPPGAALDNASAGISRYKSFENSVRIQAATNGPGGDAVEMILATDAVPGRHHTVQPEKPYS